MMSKQRCWISVVIALIFIQATYASDLMDRDHNVNMLRDLKARVESFLSARRSANHQLMYPFYSSEFRSQISLEEFKTFPQGPSISMMAYYIEALNIDSDEGVVYLVVFSLPPGLPSPRLTKNIVQQWVRENGEWFKNPRVLTRDASPRICGNRIHPSQKTNQTELAPAISGR